ncbi:hypothetical protein F4802DRAFT_563255 [Xylaria palmicola]|nr:hypothetical protein F4802DRAFT_563255 [Xylaria palmicola]
METVFRSYIQCINEERWHDLPACASFPLDLNGEAVPGPEALAAKITAAGRLRLDIDAITLDEATRRLGATLLARLLSSGAEPVRFAKQSLAWIGEDGKISRLATLRDDAAQPSPPDLVSAYHPTTPPEQALSSRALEDKYRTYIACINARTLAGELPSFCHGHVVHNARRLSLDEYRLLIREALTAVPDIVFGLADDAVVADGATQRVAARIEFTGTPTGTLAGVEATGRPVHFNEHVTYSFRDGKIDRVWSIVDWESYRRQLSQG